MNKTIHEELINLRSLKKEDYLLVGSVLFSGLLPILFIGSDIALNVRFGIDAALYADGAQSILEHENQPNLANISALHPGSLSTALFFQNFRWGSAFLMAIASLVSSSPHSLVIGAPLICVILFLIAGLALRILTFRKDIRLPVLFLAVALTAGNTFFVRLFTEGQWPNLIAILITIFLIYITANQYSNFENSSERIRLNIVSFLAFCSILITYAEILPLLTALIIFTHIAAGVAFRKNRFFSSICLNMIPLFLTTYIYFALSNPSQISYFRFLILPSYSNVGYPTPRTIFPTDMLGITDLWTSPDRWLAAGVSVQRLSTPDLVGLSIVNILLIVLIFSTTWSALKPQLWINRNSLSHSKRGIQLEEQAWNVFSILAVVSLSSLLIYSWLSSQLIQKSDYLLIKASSILLIPLIIEILSLIGPQRGKARKHNQVFTVSVMLIFALIVFTNVQNLVQLKTYSSPLRVGNLVKSWDKDSKSNCVYLFNKRGAKNSQFRYVDRTSDYYMDSVFRNDIILDPWTNQSLTRPVDAANLEQRHICLAFRSPFPTIANTAEFTLLFEDKDWQVFNTELTYAQAVNKFGALENLQLFAQP